MRAATLGGWLAVGLSFALVARVIAIDNAGAIVIVAPALVGGLVAVRWPQRRGALATVLVLIGITATLSLIGGIGLLYVPSLILVGTAATRRKSMAVTGIDPNGRAQ